MIYLHANESDNKLLLVPRIGTQEPWGDKDQTQPWEEETPFDEPSDFTVDEISPIEQPVVEKLAVEPRNTSGPNSPSASPEPAMLTPAVARAARATLVGGTGALPIK